ncbi:RNA polymerase sigma-70 factor [uncultured Muribaculum sp.]|uniref:RNA polymerase sigma-70 factor n=1 Tax=uncultured Muribaculum sp. TaxID=1918613 RepID=UPI0025EA1D04|nr:RNA polymerase sigma-70 factor [uncultured Muribaculum sp.]
MTDKDTSDSRLMQLLQGEEDTAGGALTLLYLRYAPRVRELAQCILHDYDEACDVAHDVFMSLWQHRNVLEGVASPSAYLFRMTRNAVLNRLKHRRIVDDYALQPFDTTSPYDPVETFSTREMVAMIRATVAGMPPLRRKIFLMSRSKGMTYQQIAEAVGVSHKTVQYHIGIALKELRKVLSFVVLFL